MAGRQAVRCVYAVQARGWFYVMCGALGHARGWIGFADVRRPKVGYCRLKLHTMAQLRLT
jgi:hypothetical protein